MHAMVIIINPVATPLLLNIAWRSGTIIYNIKIPIRLSIPSWVTDKCFLFERPRCLGNKLVIANGHTFRQIPTATTNKSGAIGIKIFQKMRMPILG